MRAFTDLLRDGDIKCDRVIRTFFNGATSDLDVWEALCRDRNSYSLTILSDPNADIALVSCRIAGNKQNAFGESGQQDQADGMQNRAC